MLNKIQAQQAHYPPQALRRDRVQDALAFLRLREKGCDRKTAKCFLLRRHCKTDATQRLVGPTGHRILKTKTPALGSTLNGWCLTGDQMRNYDLGQGYEMTADKVTSLDSEQERIFQAVQKNVQAIRSDQRRIDEAVRAQTVQLDQDFGFSSCKNVLLQPEQNMKRGPSNRWWKRGNGVESNPVALYSKAVREKSDQLHAKLDMHDKKCLNLLHGKLKNVYFYEIQTLQADQGEEEQKNVLQKLQCFQNELTGLGREQYEIQIGDQVTEQSHSHYEQSVNQGSQVLDNVQLGGEEEELHLRIPSAMRPKRHSQIEGDMAVQQGSMGFTERQKKLASNYLPVPSKSQSQHLQALTTTSMRAAAYYDQPTARSPTSFREAAGFAESALKVQSLIAPKHHKSMLLPDNKTLDIPNDLQNLRSPRHNKTTVAKVEIPKQRFSFIDFQSSAGVNSSNRKQSLASVREDYVQNGSQNGFLQTEGGVPQYSFTSHLIQEEEEVETALHANDKTPYAAHNQQQKIISPRNTEKNLFKSSGKKQNMNMSILSEERSARNSIAYNNSGNTTRKHFNKTGIIKLSLMQRSEESFVRQNSTSVIAQTPKSKIDDKDQIIYIAAPRHEDQLRQLVTEAITARQQGLPYNFGNSSTQIGFQPKQHTLIDDYNLRNLGSSVQLERVKIENKQKFKIFQKRENIKSYKKKDSLKSTSEMQETNSPFYRVTLSTEASLEKRRILIGASNSSAMASGHQTADTAQSRMSTFWNPDSRKLSKQ